MTTQTLQLTDGLLDYLKSISLREHPVLKRLREENANHPFARFQIAPEQGQFMALLIRLIGARRAIEIGVFTGYSSLVTALAMPSDGKLVACDNSKEYTSVAQKAWKEAGVENKILLRLGSAMDTLDEMIEKGDLELYDFAFIDADKENYEEYYERLLQLIRPGGLITVDNVLWSGRVVDPMNEEEDTLAIRHFNETLSRDERIDLSVLPIGDGLTLAVKR